MFVVDDPGASHELLAELAVLVDKLVSLDASELHPADRAELLQGLARESGRLAAQQALLAHAADQAGDWVTVGATSARTWLAQLTRSQIATAGQQLRVGAALAHLRRVALAALDGDLSRDAVEVLATTAAPDTLPYARRDEQLLLSHARELRLAQLTQVVAHWRRRAKDEAGHGRPPDPRERRSFRLGTAGDGFGIGSITLDPEALATVLAALTDVAGPRIQGDRRSPARRRADALVELCDAHLKGQVPGGRGAAGISVLVPLPASGDWDPAGAATVDGTPVDPQWLERLLCNSLLRRVVLDADGLPLDVGRDERFATPAIWHALVARDGGCSHPWCDRPPGWCEAHHITGSWDHPHTTTSVDQMTLACARHHHLTHEGGWHIHMDHGRPIWTDPTGHPVHGPP